MLTSTLHDLVDWRYRSYQIGRLDIRVGIHLLRGVRKSLVVLVDRILMLMMVVVGMRSLDCSLVVGVAADTVDCNRLVVEDMQVRCSPRLDLESGYIGFVVDVGSVESIGCNGLTFYLLSVSVCNG